MRTLELHSYLMTEKYQTYKYVWTCAYRRRYNAELQEDWELYDREHSTLLMCMSMVKWDPFNSDKQEEYQQEQND